MSTINSKPAAGLFGGALSGLGIGLLNRYTSYHPSVEEAVNIVILTSFGVAWLVPERLWKRADGVVEQPEFPPHSDQGI